MTTRRDVLQLGALGAAGLAGIEFGKDGSSGDAPSRLAPQNTPVPYRGVFRRPPELVPYATTFDGGDPDPAVRPLRPHRAAGPEPRSCRGCRHRWPATTASSRGRPSGPARGPGSRCGSATASRKRPGCSCRSRSDTSTHLHGSPSLPQYDGYANDITVPGFVKNYHYPNGDRASTLWYHDHRHLVTAQNVYSGLAAFYPISDPFERAQLPQGEFDVPLMISDAHVQRRRLAALQRQRTTRGCGATSSWSTGCRGRR